MLLSKVFASLACLLAVATMGMYMRQIKNGTTVPNLVSILIWLVSSLINAATYLLITRDSWKGAIAVVYTALCLITLVYSLKRRKFAPVVRVDALILLACATVGVAWVGFRSFGSYSKESVDIAAYLANLVVAVFSSGPIFFGLLAGRLKENPRSWTMSCASYIFASLAVWVSYDGNFLSLAFPLINGIGVNGAMTLVILVINHRSRT